MATYQVRIEDLIGVPSQGADAQLITDSLSDAAKEIINLAPANFLWSTTTTSGDQTSNGFALIGIKVLSVVRENGVDGQYVECKEVPLNFERKVQDVNSMFYPSKQEPVFFRKDAAINVYPAPGASPNAFKVNYVVFPAIAYTESMGDNQFPVDWDSALVYGAALRNCNRFIADVDTEYNDATLKAQNLVDGATMSGDTEPQSTQYWLNDEDPEMVQATLTTAGQELSRAQALLGKRQAMQQTYENMKGLYTQELQILFPKPQAQG